MASFAAADKPRYLFGGHNSPWDTSSWTSSDDRVRGGKSYSHLEPDIDTRGKAVIFQGELDITALGGAGFASQRTVDDFQALDLSNYDALILDIKASDQKKYTFIMKDTILSKRPDGREQSTISWEYDFECPGHCGSGRVLMNFKDFKPTYRGKSKPDAEPLNLKDVKRLSIMIRSFFGEQQGPFSMTLLSLAAIKHKHRPQSRGTEQSLEKVDLGKSTSNLAQNGWASWLSRICGNRSH